MKKKDIMRYIANTLKVTKLVKAVITIIKNLVDLLS